ncbi:MAG: AAA family ATPase [Cyanobacteria bacterium P01_H01_bin.15]
MKTVLLGNAGAGKSTLSRKLLEKEPAARLSLDELAFSGGPERRPLADSIADAMGFIEANKSWIVEGCYSDIVEPILTHAETLIFLNPGVDVCVSHCKSRPWEPEKFESSEAQDSNLENLLAWVREYETREDEYGLKQHRKLFEAFEGHKIEYASPSKYAAV